MLPRRFLIATLFVIGVIGSSCRNEKLPVIDLGVGDITIQAEVARTPLERERGLMFRRTLGEKEGMLFVYDTDQRLTFWMRNTYVPLSIAFISSEGEITQIEEMRPQDESMVISRRSVRYALEVNRAAFKKWGAGVGDKIVFPQDFQR